MIALFKHLGVNETTRWRAAYRLVLEADEWKEDEELQTLAALDVLLAFEDYSRIKEREYEENSRKRQVEKTAKERKAREAFKVTLSQGKETCWANRTAGTTPRTSRPEESQSEDTLERYISQFQR